MRRFGFVLAFLASCTRVEEPQDAPPLPPVAEPACDVEPASTDPAPTPAPTEVDPPEAQGPEELPTSEEPWVWAEASFADFTCLAGCPTRAALRDSAWFRPPYSVDLREPESPRLLAFADDGAELWQRPFELDPAFDAAPRPRALRCGPAVFAAFDRDDHAEYRILRFDATSGEPLPGMAQQRLAMSGLSDHAIQVGCLEDGGLRVFGRFHHDDAETLYVHELSPELELRAARTLPGALAEPALRRRAKRAKTTLDYRFWGGEREPWFIGIDARRLDRMVVKPEHLRLEASQAGSARWTVDLGPAVSRGTQVLEFGELTIVRIQSELVALRTEDGTITWRMHGWGSLGEKARRPGDLGLYGCSRCRTPRYHVRVHGDHLVLTGLGDQEWINVIEPTTGRVLVRRMWS